MVRRGMVVSCVYGRVRAFYPPCAREGNPILQVKSSKSVEAIRGHSKQGIELLTGLGRKGLRQGEKELFFNGSHGRMGETSQALRRGWFNA
jgi:hypothetical protein